jgi:hypothetical protein
MKARYGISLAAIMVTSLALVVFMGAGIGNAVAPDPQLADDLVLMGNGGTGANNIKVIDIDGMAVVNTIAAGTSLANNHDTILDASGRYLWNTNALLAGGKMRVTKFDLGTLTQVGVYDSPSADGMAMSTGLCGIEYDLNDKTSGKIWVNSMSTSTTNGGTYAFNEADPNGSPWEFVDTSAGTDSGQQCGIGWNTGGTIAYHSLMAAAKTTESSWPGGVLTGRSGPASTPANHQLDVDKANGIMYVTAGRNASGAGYIDIFDTATMAKVNVVVVPAPSQPHDVEIAHTGFMYVHSREGMPVEPKGVLLIYDIGGGSAGGTRTAPVLIGSIPDQGTGTVSCGNETLVKSDYCSEPALSLSKTSTYWGSYADYTARQLSVDYSIGNGAGLTNAYNVTIAGATNSNGVTMASATAGGNIPAGSSAAVTIKYNIPVGVGQFTSTVYATANDLCNNTWEYPGPAPLA